LISFKIDFSPGSYILKAKHVSNRICNKEDKEDNKSTSSQGWCVLVAYNPDARLKVQKGKGNDMLPSIPGAVWKQAIRIVAYTLN